MANNTASQSGAAKRPSVLQYPVLILFCVFFFGLFALDVLTPDRARSELENTTLTQRPALPQELTAAALNSYFSTTTRYVKDQVFARDGWIGLQSTVEARLFQKTESGGILLGQDGMLFPRHYGLLNSETRNLPKNIKAIQSLIRRHPDTVTVALVPAASTVYPEKVPAGAPILDEAPYLDQISAAVTEAGGQYLDLRPVLEAHRDEYLYYRTDHHWTTLGAYYAYTSLCNAWGLTPFDPAAHSTRVCDSFYGTHFSKARNPDVVPDTITCYELDAPLTIYTVTGPGMPQQGETVGLYDWDKLDVYDKYAAFLHGNNGLSRVQGEGAGSVLILKDSFANCFVPYLTANYENIDVVDFRNYNYSLDPLIEANGYDRILVLYSFDSFKSDMYLYRAGAAG